MHAGVTLENFFQMYPLLCRGPICRCLNERINDRHRSSGISKILVNACKHFLFGDTSLVLLVLGFLICKILSWPTYGGGLGGSSGSNILTVRFFIRSFFEFCAGLSQMLHLTNCDFWPSFIQPPLDFVPSPPGLLLSLSLSVIQGCLIVPSPSFCDY